MQTISLKEYSAELDNEETREVGIEIAMKIAMKKGLMEGKEIGIKKGRKIGELIGQEVGKVEGIKEKAFEVAEKLIARDMAISDIAEITNLKVKTLKSLQKLLTYFY